MRLLKNWMCLLTVLALVGSMAACGNKNETVPSESTTEISNAELSEEDDDSDDDAPIDMEHLVIKTEESSAENSAVESREESADDASEAAENSDSTEGSSTSGAEQNSQSSTASQSSGAEQAQNSKPDESTAGNNNSKPSSDSKTEQPVSSAAGSSSSVAETQAATEAAVEEVSGIIQLGSSISYEGSGISIEGNKVLITGEGTYVITGTLPEGMIEVNTTFKVKLKLNGVSVTNSSGPAILVTDAKKLTITLIEGTTNTLTDGTSTAYDGAICTNDTLEIKGAGTLHITANNAHGISSDDDIIVKNGEITINAVKSGMMANDDITISGGTLHVTGGTNGIKSKGTMHISGGTIWSIGGPKENKSALYSAGAFTLTGGSIYAVGCGASEPDAASSTQNAVSVKLTPSLAANSSVGMTLSGKNVFEVASPYAFNTIFVSTPDLTDGSSFNVQANGSDLGSFTVSGGMTSVTANT